jgi:hypothetical protein
LDLKVSTKSRTAQPGRQAIDASPEADRLKNWEIAVYALFLEGGTSKPVHTEDVALACYRLAPDAFSWIRHAEYPDKDIARVALTDARKVQAGALVSGRAGRGRRKVGKRGDTAEDGWMLSERGAAWIAANESRLASSMSQREQRQDRQNLLKRLSRVREHVLFRRFLADRNGFSATLGEMADLYRCRPDAPLSVWRRRVGALQNKAQIARQSDTLEFLIRCLSILESRENSESGGAQNAGRDLSSA